MVERGQQPNVVGQQHPVAEHVTAHVPDTDNGEVLRLGVHAHFAEVPLDALPRALGGDAHLLVVVAHRPARGERVTEPEPVGLRDFVGDVGEGRGALVGRHDEVRVVPVTAHDVVRGDDLAGGLVDVVGEVEQPRDEQLVAGDALVALRVAVGGGVAGALWRLLDDESALGADGHDDGVLHRLRLDQTKDLGAEVLQSIRPPQPAAGDEPEPQVHALDPRRIHEDLELRPRQWKFVDQLRVQLDREHVVRAGRILAADKVVGAQRGLNHRREAAQHPVGVQTGQRVDVGGYRCGGGLRGAAIRVTRRIKQGFEELDQRPRGTRIAVEHRLDVGLTVRKTRLPQVLRVRAQNDHLLPRQARAQHQLVEPVDLGAAVPDRGDGVGEPHRGRIPFGPFGLFGNVAQHRDLELVDPHRKSVGPSNRERALFEHDHAHALQHRQQLAQRCRSPAEVPGQLCCACVIVAHVREHQLDRIILQLFDDRDVLDRVLGRDGLLVVLVERGRVVACPGLVDRSGLDRTEQPIAPGSRRLGQQVLNTGLVLDRNVDVSGA